jgi:nucleotide-binding universal stress UspA family protein
MGDDRILICYDGSGEARNAINTAASLLKLRHAIVLEIESPLRVTGSFAALSADVLDNSFGDLNADDALRRSRAGAELAEEAGFMAEARANLASPTWEGIVDTANEVNARVIVIGSRGLTGARERLEGNVSHEVAQHAGRPVLIVPSQWADGSRRREQS